MDNLLRLRTQIHAIFAFQRSVSIFRHVLISNEHCYWTSADRPIDLPIAAPIGSAVFALRPAPRTPTAAAAGTLDAPEATTATPSTPSHSRRMPARAGLTLKHSLLTGARRWSPR